MRQITLTAVFILFCSVLQGQLSVREAPLSFSSAVPALRSSAQTQKVMPPLDMQRIEREDREAQERGAVGVRFGYKHEADFNLENSGEWHCPFC